MVVMITGGRGTLGRLLVPRVVAAGFEAVVTSRTLRPGPQATPTRVLDLGKGEIPPDLLQGVEVIVHAASNPARSKSIDVEGTRQLCRAAASAGVEHFIYISIVGIDEHPFPYYRAKLAAEKVIAESGVPFTILRATQFHEFMDRIFSTGPVVTAFRGIEFQVIDGGVVADRLVELVEVGPSARAPDLGGPQSESMTDMAHSWKTAFDSRKIVVRVPVIGKAARAFKQKMHHTPNAAAGTPTWSEWLARRRSEELPDHQ